VTPNPLPDFADEAARLLADGTSQAAVAERFGTSSTSIRRLLKREDFRALVEEHRPAEPSAPPAPVPTDTDSEEEEVLRRAMRLTNSRDEPTQTAIKAALVLANLKAARAEESAATHTVERVLLTGHADTDAEVRAILDSMGPAEGGWVVLAERDVSPESTGFVIHRLTDHPWRPSEAEAPPVPVDPHPADDAG
jgi:hypothetical protein